MGRNPIQSAGCFGILKSVQENPDSAMETLDFSVIHKHTHTHTRFNWDFPQMFFIMNLFSLFLLPASLFPGHHSEPGFWRPVYGSERNFPRAYSKSRGQNWYFQKKQRLEKCLCANCLKEVWANCCSCMPEEIGKDVSLLQASRTFSSTDEPKEGCMQIWCLNEVSFLKQPWENFSLN